MARDSGRASEFPYSTLNLVDERTSELKFGEDFATDHPILDLHLRRVHSTNSDWSDCTLPEQTVNMDIYRSQETGGNLGLSKL